jgi:hypothetical protein
MLLMLLFPTGQLPSSRWRPVLWATIGATVVAVVGTVLTPGPVEYYPGLQNPLGVAGAGPVLDVIVGVGFVVMVAGVFAAAGSLIVRWRRARGVERQQLKWLAYAAGPLVVAQLSASMLPRPLFLAVSYTAALPFPVATGIAVVRYRLYDIDRIINRTLVYGLLTALLAGIYTGVVLVLSQLFGGIGEEAPSWAVAGAILAVAALFQPARVAFRWWLTAASTDRSTTPPGRLKRSAPGFVTRLTWTPSRPSYSPWSIRRCSRARHGCGFDLRSSGYGPPAEPPA